MTQLLSPSWSRGTPIAAAVQRRTAALRKLGLALIPVAWLLPNHYLPWLSAWQDGFAMAALALVACLCQVGGAIARPFAAALVLATLSVAVQSLTGVILFTGDAVAVWLYLAAFGLALVVGNGLAAPREGPRDDSPDAPNEIFGVFAASVVMCAAISVGVALVQWTKAYQLVIFMAELPPGARPFGNVAQPNHLCTIAFMGLCGLGVLHQSRRIGTGALAFGSTFLVLGMVMSGSRTAWLQLAALAVVVMPLRKRADLRLGPRWLAFVIVGFVVATLLWPGLNELLDLSGQRSPNTSLGSDARPPFWRLILDAIGQRPLVGYGWQQVVVAQMQAALDVPAVQRHFEFAHNIVLDLLVWAGVPVGGLIVVFLIWGFLRLIRRCRDGQSALMLAAVAGLGMHALVEHPHAFAYFLIPAGVMLGAALGRAPAQAVRIPGRAVAVLGAVFAVALAVVGRDYLLAEENFRAFRLESAGVGADRPRTEAPRLLALTQLQAFLQFVRVEARPGMSDDELEQMRRVSTRFAYPPALLRYALAAGLNHRAAEAGLTLARLCAIHRPARCDEAEISWAELRSQFPRLEAVPVPWRAAR